MRIGITNRGHRKRIIQLVESLPPEDIEQEVPVSMIRDCVLLSLFTKALKRLNENSECWVYKYVVQIRSKPSRSNPQDDFKESKASSPKDNDNSPCYPF